MGLHFFGLRISLLFLSLWSTIAVAQMSVIPAAPQPQETVRFHAEIVEGIVETTVSMVGNRITVALVRCNCSDFVVLPARSVEVSLGQFPTGDYQVEVTRRTAGFADTVAFGTTSFSVSPRDRSKPLSNYSDLWWNPSESGWGLNIVQHPSGIIFATWFTYDPDGTPAWYVVPSGGWIAIEDGNDGGSNQYRGPIYRTNGPPVADSFDPSRVTRTLVGEALFQFVGYNTMRSQLTIDGKSMTKNLQRQGF
jgi:hypothetical protein